MLLVFDFLHNNYYSGIDYILLHYRTCIYCRGIVHKIAPSVKMQTL